MKKSLRLSALITVFTLLLPALFSCAAQKKNYQRTYYDFFDTSSTVTARMESKKDFETFCVTVRGELEKYHRLFDIYNTYDGIVNLKNLNDAAGSKLSADTELCEFLLYCKDIYTLTYGYTNVALGSVLSLWHDCRTAALENPVAAAIPDGAVLEVAAKHTDISSLCVDAATGIVSISDPLMSLDVGAVGKGYASQKICELLKDAGYTDFILNIGGNVSAYGLRDGSKGWYVGVENPRDTSETLCLLSLSGKSLVTSGSYQRYYTVNGVRYHHIINPDTLKPSEYYLSVSVLCDDSALADALSTALFCMTLEKGQALVASLDGVEAMWVAVDGSTYYSDDFCGYIVPD